jgi:hypothetical protein
MQTNGIYKEMRFLITDIGNEDILLGYPWLVVYEPKFSWRHGTIDEQNLPIVICTVNPQMAKIKPVIACLLTENQKFNILTELTRDSVVVSIATELAIAARERDKAEIPQEYAKFSKVFSKEESKKFPLARPWDHAIKFKPHTPDAIDCK